MRKLIIGAVIGASLAGSVAAASANGSTWRAEDDGVTVIVRGNGFGTAEDMTTLRLVEYSGSDSPIIYRVVTP